MDLVVAVPKDRWLEWIEEGDAVDAPPSGEEWGFYVSGKPDIQEGDRLYVVAWGRLRGYAPVTGVQRSQNQWAILRKGGAVAVTIPLPLKGFRGYQPAWWGREEEVPFENWRTEGVPRRALEGMATKFELGKQRAAVEAVRTVEMLTAPGRQRALPSQRNHVLAYAREFVAPQFWEAYVLAFEAEVVRLVQARPNEWLPRSVVDPRVADLTVYRGLIAR